MDVHVQTRLDGIRLLGEIAGATSGIALNGKCIVFSVGQVTTPDGDDDGTEVVYDADGYLQSVKMNMQGQSTEVKYLWENGRLVGQVLNVMGTDMKLTHIYDDKGVVTGEKMDMGGQVMEMPYSDIKVDDHGNWISRKASMMGQEMENTRTIEYY